MQDFDQADDFQDHQSTQFPVFPVVFRQQQEKQLDEGVNTSIKVFKMPEQQIKDLITLLDKKYETVYPEFFKESWKDSSIERFFQVYRPLNEEFITQMKVNKQNLKIVRISSHKIYIGEFNQDKCNGRSIIIFKNGNIFEGMMKDNKRQGKGIYFQSGVGWFNGTFVNDMKSDKGVQINYKRWVYKGGFLNGLRSEKGLFVDKKSDIIYNGSWKLGIMHGRGTLKTKQSIFQGTIVNSLKHGSGQERFTNGDVYRGDYQNNRFDGFGTYAWREGAIYQGSFKNGLRHGKGKWSFGQTKYSGSYAEGLKQGYGQLYFPSGNFYKGNFVSDKREGYGQMFWTDGSFYKGDWKAGIQNGKGQTYLVGAEVVSGIFQNGILVQVTPSIYEKQMQISSMGIHDLFGSNAQLQSNNIRTFSESKNIPSAKRKLTKIDEGRKKSAIKDNIYFNSPQKNDNSRNKQSSINNNGFQQFSNSIQAPVNNFQGYNRHRASVHDHSHGKSGQGRECKCMKRLQNFRLRQHIKTKLNDSKVDQGLNQEI